MRNVLLFFACLISSLCYAQEEVKLFEKVNKALIKQLKSEYKMKVTTKVTDLGTFYFELSKKGADRMKYLLASESGNIICNEELDFYLPIGGTDNLFIGKAIGGKPAFGLVSTKGQLLLPMEYSNIRHIKGAEEGEYTYENSTYYRPHLQETYILTKEDQAAIRNIFLKSDLRTVIAEYTGTLTDYKESYLLLDAGNGINSKALLTTDGRMIFPPQYSSFNISQNGFIRTTMRVSDLSLEGGKNIKTDMKGSGVPNSFYFVTWSDAGKKYRVKLHRDEEYEDYNPDKVYELAYVDDGQRYYDALKDTEVITYYEGDGYGKPWGCYYMGLAAYNIGHTEDEKLDKVINTLKSKTNYSLPITKPEKYQFNAGTITSMYVQSIGYLEKYIESEGQEGVEPEKVQKAKKLRGKIVMLKNNITSKLGDYQTSLTAASNKYAQVRSTQIQREAQQEAAAQSLSNSILNLLGGGSNK